MQLITLVRYDQEPDAYLHWCTGCCMEHPIVIQRNTPGPTWTYNGDAQSPSVHPSLSISMGRHRDGREWICHYTLTAGILHYHEDTSHRLKGISMPLPPFPQGYLDQEEISTAVSFYDPS